MREYNATKLTADDHFRRNLARRCHEHGITLDEYEHRLKSQRGGCAICGTTDFGRQARPCFDHDHATGAFRGLICASCNHGLGEFADSPGRLRAAATYIESAR